MFVSVARVGVLMKVDSINLILKSYRCREALYFTRILSSLQAMFLAADPDVPVYLIRGKRDLYSYRATMALMCGGLGYMSYIMYKMAYGIK